MKRFSILILVLISSLTNGFTQQHGWKEISKNLPDYPFDTTIINNGADTVIAIITDISFITNDEGWMTTWHAFSNEHAAILHTTDGGETWEVQTVMRPCQVIHMVDATIGYAGSDGGLIFNTTDGGENWTYYGITGAPVTGMSFPPGSDTGYVCSYMSSNLQQITPAGVNPIPLGNADWWHSLSAPSHELIWISSGNSVWTFDEDGLTDQPIASTWYNSIFFVRNDLGWGVGHDGVKGSNPGTISGCTGKNIPWVHLKYTEQPLYEVFALDENHVWAGGYNGYIYYSENASDFGFDSLTSTGWSNVNFVSQPNPRPDVEFLSLFFTSPQNGFASGGKNVLLKYSQVSGFEEAENLEFEVFPNPARDKFKMQNIKCKPGDCDINLVDFLGRKVMDVFEGKLSLEEIEINVSHLPAGVYFVQLVTGNGLMTRKIILSE